MSIVKKELKTTGMICESCEKVISKHLSKLPGVSQVKVDYAESKTTVEYDSEKISLSEIKEKIAERGYHCEEEIKEEKKETPDLPKKELPFTISSTDLIPLTIIGLGVFVLLFFALRFYNTLTVPTLSQNMGYGLLFLVGLLTGFHCIAMCGGFVISYTAKGAKEGRKPLPLHASYALGKTISYTIIGAIFGLLGSIIAFTPTMRGWAGILAGAFLFIFGIKMLGIFPSLNKFQIKLPQFLNRWVGHESQVHHQNPFVIGLLNGLMIACGPLQALYIMAAGTGSMVEGAKMLFIFGLGTLPVMLGFGYLTSLISAKATMKLLRFSGVIIVILGLIMVNRGLALAGTGYDWNSLASGNNLFGSGNDGNSPFSGSNLVIKDGYQEIRMTVDNQGFTPNKFVLKKGVPVKWIIDGKQLNGCNSNIQVSKYNLQFEVKPGLQTIEFTPTEEGTFSWSCWMGMLQGAFVVKENVDQAAVDQTLDQVNVPKGASCGMSGGGGCGCGGGRQ